MDGRLYDFLAFGAMQLTIRIVSGLPGMAHAGARFIEQTVGKVQLLQELGGVTGRVLFVVLIIRIAGQRRRLFVFLGSALVVYGWMYLYGVTPSLTQLQAGMFPRSSCIQWLYSFWGNYLPTAFPLTCEAQARALRSISGEKSWVRRQLSSPLNWAM